MKKPIQILVRDSFHTGAIAKSVAEFFGSNATVYEVSCPTDIKVDVFILSGRDILQSSFGSMAQLKKERGSDLCVVVATSALGDYLDEIMSDPRYGADFAVFKSQLVTSLTFAEDDGTHAWSRRHVFTKILERFSLDQIDSDQSIKKARKGVGKIQKKRIGRSRKKAAQPAS